MKRNKEIIKALNLDEMKRNGYNILEECDIYSPTEYGMNKIEKTWLNAKSTPVWGEYSLFEIFANHPNWVADKGYIVLGDEEYHRQLDFETIDNVLYKLYCANALLKEEIKIGAFEYLELCRMMRRLDDLITDSDELRKYGIINDAVFNRAIEDFVRLKETKRKYHDGEKVRIEDNTAYTVESYNAAERFGRIMYGIKSWIYENKSNFDNSIEITENIVRLIENNAPEIKGLRVGQSVNKVVGKICRHFEIDKKYTYYNQQIARLGDAASPITYTRYTIVSLNRNDYWTMSFGDNWCSCANIDKQHNRRSSQVGMYGDGCCSSGTESYMLDPSTVVVYTVDKHYNGRDYELQDKINRCLFHIGDGKFVMGRIYPQGTDGAENVYKEWRTIFQKILSDSLGIPNYWKTQRDDKSYQYETYGTHYEDYAMDYCNVAGWSWHKPFQDSVPSSTRIKIGHNPICPKCGNEHYERENIQCCDNHICYGCDSHEDSDNHEYHEIDGRWYCERCCFYCDYHERWEIGDPDDQRRVENYGTICDYAAYYSGYFFYCEECETWHHEDDEHYYTDYGTFCSESCMNDAGIYYCSECGEYVREENYDSEYDMCNRCAERERESEE